MTLSLRWVEILSTHIEDLRAEYIQLETDKYVFVSYCVVS